jgi:hypothetical protein
MALISKKKKIFKISPFLRVYLDQYDRHVEAPIEYADLLRYDSAIPLYDSNGNDTLWQTVFYPQGDMEDIHEALKRLYAILKAAGDLRVMDHLRVDRVDVCTYANTLPFRIRIVNEINDNFDYFYIKVADSSRIYGLELEHLLSPNRISYYVHSDTLIEEHIIGIPGDAFIKHHLNHNQLNKIRLAKEFVKFNERCFVRLLGDMHSSNFVVDVTPDFEEITYRIKSIDFDQQSYEGKKNIYLPQYFKENNPLIQIGLDNMTPETARQYRREERALIANRFKVEKKRIDDLLHAMSKDKLSSDEKTGQLKKDLAKYYKDPSFLECQGMGDLVKRSLQLVVERPHLFNE